MNLEPTIQQLDLMMDYLKLRSFVIPSYSMSFPTDIADFLYRPEKVFRLIWGGTMTYSGTGSKGNISLADVHIGGIKLTQPWIDRAYIHLVDLVTKDIERKIGNPPSFPRIGELLLRFHKLEFISLGEKLTEVKYASN
jgi:hypothetical protein